MDPHRRSATIEVLDAYEHVLGGSSYGSDVAGYRSMLNTVCVADPVLFSSGAAPVSLNGWHRGAPARVL